MCSITGCISRQKKPIDFDLLKSIIIKAEDRGRDSFGIVYLGKDYYKEQKFIGKPSAISFEMIKDDSVSVIMNNNRAEPTTEYVENKTLLDVQPFSYCGTFVAHNGTIANDKELEKIYDLKRNTKIDSAIVPPLLNKIWDGKDEKKLVEILNSEIIGSYAMSIWDNRNPETLWLAVNYKPMFLLCDFENDIIYYTSLESYLSIEDLNSYFNSKFKIYEVKPYTLLKISKDNIESFSLYKSKKGKEKALIVCSSGLDSTVSAAWAKKEGYDISLLHFKYGCRAQKAEERAIKEISEFFNCDLITIPIDIFKNVIKNSRLTNPDECGELMKDGDGEKSAELAWEWVPARNLIFLSIAAGYAEAYKFDYIILGGNLEESSSYADNELIFQKKFNDILPNALNLQNRVRLLTPVANLMKHEIIKLGIECGAPLHLTWSCYEDGEKPCGTCGPDFMRKVGFKMNGIKDMQNYKNEKENFWNDCKNIILKNGRWEITND